MSPQIFALFIPILALMIPIVAILTTHQRRMAEFYASQAQTEQNPDIAALRHEIYELKQLVHQQAIALDNLTHRSTTQAPPNIQERVSNGL